MDPDYAEFRKNLAGKIKEKTEFRELATFLPNKKLPVYNWFYYKEGFSKHLVEKLLRAFHVSGGIVLDPFCGAGTTLLACRQNGINAVGYDVLPVSVFASRVKTQNHDIDKLKESLQALSKAGFRKLNIIFPHLLRRAFSKYALQDIALLREEIKNLNPELREFFTLALMNAAMKCSYAYKDGSVIKFRKRNVAPLRKMFLHVAKKMINDLERMQQKNAEVSVELQDARYIPLENESVDAIIMSPPYLNQIDYTKVYAIEEFFIHSEPLPGVRAYVGMNAKETDFMQEFDLPAQARLYFDDMNQVLGESYRVLKKGSFAAIVVGNGFIEEEIESDIILSYLAAKIGFRLVKIYVLNKRFALEDRTIKRGTLRESLIILKK